MIGSVFDKCFVVVTQQWGPMCNQDHSLNRAVSEAVINAWTNFAKKGNPNFAERGIEVRHELSASESCDYTSLQVEIKACLNTMGNSLVLNMRTPL
jgi:hypothetical protein